MMKLRLRVMEGEYAVWKAPTGSVASPMETRGLWAEVRTEEEVSVVGRAEYAPVDVKCERGWRCIKVEGPLAFEMVGVIASITGALAAAKVSVFVVSTYDTDYVLVKDEKLEQTRKALEKAGHVFGAK
jgi:uncharacterized protein